MWVCDSCESVLSHNCWRVMRPNIAGMRHLRLIEQRRFYTMLCCGLAWLLVVQSCPAQSIAPGVANQASADFATLPRFTPVHLRLNEIVSSATAKNGQKVDMTVDDDVVADGFIIVPKGTPVIGVVKHVHRGIPKKRNGSFQIRITKIRLANGTEMQVRSSLPVHGFCGHLPDVCDILLYLYPPDWLILIAIRANSGPPYGDDMTLNRSFTEQVYTAIAVQLPAGTLRRASIPDLTLGSDPNRSDQ